VIFFGILYISNIFTSKRIEEVRSIEDKISLDLLSSETQFALLKDSSCKAIDHSTAFSEELNNLTQKLSYMEENLGVDNTEVISLQKYYSLLQIKDYLLVNQVKEKCSVKPITIIYFYSNKDGECDDCVKEGYVLSKLRDDFPELRIYSFDYNLDLSAVKTMVSIQGVRNKLPALIIRDEPYYGFKSAGDLESIIPELKMIRIAQEKAAAVKTATSTKN
jgi:hypothetical protein